ncbi:uncharacterized protein DS421_5g136830 [Arachis hypogaea]|nr:uncharacterized protein DS421_5g136830 [Arachis hypogaea]
MDKEGDVAATVDLNEGGDEWQRAEGQHSDLDEVENAAAAAAHGSEQRGKCGGGGGSG